VTVGEGKKEEGGGEEKEKKLVRIEYSKRYGK